MNMKTKRVGRALVVTALLIAATLGTLVGCDEAGANPGGGTPTGVVINGPADFMNAVDIPGASRASGAIPAPSGEPGLTITTESPEIIITSNSEFTWEYTVEGTEDDVTVLYVQFEGVNEHFVVDLTQASAAATLSEVLAQTVRSPGPCPPAARCPMTARGASGIRVSPQQLTRQVEVNTTVRAASMPLQAGVPDFSFIHDRMRWSNPVTIRTRALEVGTGTLQVSLTWNTTADLDLWLTEPNGNRIWYANPVSASGGELDYDNVTGYGPENIFYTTTPPSGTYEVRVNHFSGVHPTNYTVTVTNSGTTRVFTGTIGQFQTVLVHSFTR